MVCIIRLTPADVLRSDAKLLSQLKQDLRQDLLEVTLPVDISYGGIPTQINDFHNAASKVYLRCYHVIMRIRLIHALSTISMSNGEDIVPHIATVTAIEMPKMVSFLKGFQPLTIMELHRINNYLGAHFNSVRFVPKEDRKLDDKIFKDPDLFIG